MNAYLEIMRPANGIMTAIAVMVGGLLILGLQVFAAPAAYMAVISAFLIMSAGNAINDYFDYEADKANRKSRPIPSGRITRSAALYYSGLLFLLGLLLAGFLPSMSFIIALVNSLLLVFYSQSLKHKAYIGNAAVSYLVGSTYIFGSSVFLAGGTPLFSFFMLPLILFFMSFFANLSREIIKDLEDVEGDRLGFLKRAAKIKWKIAERFGVTKRGVVLRINKKTAVAAAFVSVIIAIGISFLPFLWGMLGIPYLAIVMLSDMAFLYTAVLILKSGSKKDYSRISRKIKISMLIGLLAFIAGAILR